MMQFFELVFYHVYKSLLKSPGELYRVADKSYPSLVSLMVLSFIEFANLIVVVLLLDTIFGFRINDYLDSLNLGNFLPIVIGGILYIINYLIMFNEDRYKKVIKEYSKKPLSERKKGARITLAYGLGSIVLVFVLAPLRVM